MLNVYCLHSIPIDSLLRPTIETAQLGTIISFWSVYFYQTLSICERRKIHLTAHICNFLKDIKDDLPHYKLMLFVWP